MLDTLMPDAGENLIHALPRTAFSDFFFSVCYLWAYRYNSTFLRHAGEKRRRFRRAIEKGEEQDRLNGRIVSSWSSGLENDMSDCRDPSQLTMPNPSGAGISEHDKCL